MLSSKAVKLSLSDQVCWRMQMDGKDKNMHDLLLVRLQHMAERNELLDHSGTVLAEMKEQIIAEIDHIQQKIKNENEME